MYGFEHSRPRNPGENQQKKQHVTLTRELVGLLTPDPKGRVLEFIHPLERDVTKPRLVLQIMPGGEKIYCLRFFRPDGTERTYELGRHPYLKPNQAVKEAGNILGKLYQRRGKKLSWEEET